jgi:hypothetical protein
LSNLLRELAVGKGNFPNPVDDPKLSASMAFAIVRSGMCIKVVTAYFFELRQNVVQVRVVVETMFS